MTVQDDTRFGEPVGWDDVTGLAVVLKALVIRNGGQVELTNPELERAARTLVQVDADGDVFTMQVVPGSPPDRPRRARDVWPPPEPVE